jgi:hypothetical protein
VIAFDSNKIAIETNTLKSTKRYPLYENLALTIFALGKACLHEPGKTFPLDGEADLQNIRIPDPRFGVNKNSRFLVTLKCNV